MAFASEGRLAHAIKVKLFKLRTAKREAPAPLPVAHHVVLLACSPCANKVENDTPVALVDLRHDEVKSSISGTVSVANFGYEKCVVLR